MNLYQRIAAVMQDVGYLAKDDSVETGGGKSYRAITEEKVTSTVRASLIKNGIVIIPVKIDHARTDERVLAFDKYAKKDVERINRITSADVTYRVQNVDEPEDYVLAVSSGTGVDTQDKGIGKALTYAYKYLLLRTFAIPTGDDPDQISSDIYTEKLTGSADRKAEKPADAEALSQTYGTTREEEEARQKLLREIADIQTVKGVDNPHLEASCRKNYKKGLHQLDNKQLKEVLEKLRAA